MATITKLIIMALFIIALPVNAITLSTTPIKPLVVYKPPAVPPSGFNTSILSGVGPVLLQAASGFRGQLTPFNVGAQAANILIGAPLMYGMMQGLQELQMQAGAGQATHTAPQTNVSPTSSGSTTWPTGTGSCANNSQQNTISDCLASAQAQNSNYINIHPVLNSFSGSSVIYAFVGQLVWNGNTYPETGVGSTWTVSNASACSTGTLGSDGKCPAPVSCPPGYVAQNNVCTIVDINAVMYPSDGKPSYIISGGQFIPDPRDPDIATDSPVMPVDRQGVDDYGNPVHERMVPNAQNGVDYTRETESVSPTSGEPLVQRDRITTNELGIVTGVYSTVYNNTTVTNTNTTNIDTSKLNQELTQQKIKDLLNPSENPDLETPKQALETKYGEATTEIQGSETNLSNNPAEKLSPVAYWTYASGTCYPATFDMGRYGSVSFDKFCQIYDEHIRMLLVFILGVYGMLHAFFYWAETVKEL
jgi:hypothetical protein